MTNSSRDYADSEMAPDLETLAKDFAAMKHDLAAIAAKFKNGIGNGASDAMHDAASNLSDRATDLYENLAAQGKRSVKAVTDQV